MSVEKKEEPTPFEKFIQQYNESYVMKCKELGLQNEYVLEINDKPVTFIRKRLTTKAYNDLEQARQKTEQDNLDNALDAMGNAKRTADVYFLVAQAYLKNKDTGLPITLEEYSSSIWEEIKIVLDACHLRTTIGVPN